MDIYSYPRGTPASIIAELKPLKCHRAIVAQLMARERIIPFVEAASADRGWCISHWELANEILHQLRSLKTTSATQAKMTRCMMELKRHLSSHDDGFCWLHHMIQTKKEWPIILELMKTLALSEAERLAISEFFLLQPICDESYLTAVAESFFLGLCSEKERFRVDLALRIAKKGGAALLSFLTHHLSRWRLSEENRCEVALTISQRKERVTLLSSILPIQFIIKDLEEFDLTERERITFAEQFLDEANQEEWSFLIQRFDSVAPSHLKDRIRFLDRILQEGGDEAIATLVDHIEQFKLPPEKLSEVAAKIIEKKELPFGLARNIGSFQLSKEQLSTIAFTLAERGSEMVLALFARTIGEFTGLEEQERYSLAKIIVRRGEEWALEMFLRSFARFHIFREEDRLFLAEALLLRSFEYEEVIAGLIHQIEQFCLTSECNGAEKSRLVRKIVDHSSSKNLAHLLERVDHFLPLLREEEQRVQFAIAIIHKVERNQTSTFSAIIPQFCLSEEKRLLVLRAMVERQCSSWFETIANDLPNYRLSRHSNRALRLQLATMIAVHGSASARCSLSRNLHHLHLHEGEIPIARIVDEVEERRIELLRRLALSPSTIELFPQLFPPSIQESFHPQINLVQQILTRRTKSELVGRIATQLISLLLYGMEKMRSNHLTSDHFHKIAPLWNELLELRNPERRDQLFLRMISQLSQLEQQRWASVVSRIKNRAAIIPAFILFSQLQKSPIMETFLLDELQQEHRFLKDGAKKNGLITFLLTATAKKTIREEELIRILRLIFQAKIHRHQLIYMQKINDLILCDQWEVVKKVNSLAEIDDLVKAMFERLFALTAIDSFKEKYERSFECFRQPQAIITYGRKIQGFSSVWLSGDFMAQLNLYVTAVLEGTFQRLRYQKEGNIHLQTIFQGKEALERVWMEGDIIKGDELLRSRCSDEEVMSISQQLLLRAEKLTVVDTDDPNDLLLMGTEIHGSCQDVNGSPYQNVCLLAYLLDGKNRLIAVKDERGRLIGRCVLRILWDGREPLLFRELLYINHSDTLVKKLVEAMALRRAKRLVLPLLADDDEGVPFRGKAQSLGSPALFEYVDAKTDGQGPIVGEGIYSLAAPKVIYNPYSGGLYGNLSYAT